MNAPAERLDLPTDADTITYANADLTHTIELFQQYGLRFLTAEEIHTAMPEYPMPARVAHEVTPVNVQGTHSTRRSSAAARPGCRE
jgi:hypothetical protein